MQDKGKAVICPITREEERQMKALFKRLDVNRDGKIDVADLTQALRTMEIPQMPGHAQVTLAPILKS